MLWELLWYSNEKQVKRKKQFVLDGLSDEEETAPEKRLRLAKEYLAQLEEEGEENGLVGLCLVTVTFRECVSISYTGDCENGGPILKP